MAIKTDRYRRLLLTLSSLADLGPVLAGEHNFHDAANSMLRLMMETAGAYEGVLFTFSEKPPQLNALAWSGMALFPPNGSIPLLARHVHTLKAAEPETITAKSWDKFLTSSGNVAPELFKCIVPLRAGSKLAGVVALGAREGGAHYDADDLNALGTLANFVALAVQNYSLSEQLQQRVVENLKLLDSMHGFCDQALEVFAAAIDAKEFRSSAHSVRVGRYAAAIAQAMGLATNEIAELRAGGYLHDIGKVTVDMRLFQKPGALEPQEFRAMADHTLLGHKIIANVEFPWAHIGEIVRSHHERGDGSGYPDHLTREQISLPVRIIAVADTFDAMTHDRPYRDTMSVGRAISELVRSAPTRFDADVVQALLACVRGESSGRGQSFLDPDCVCNIAPADIDQLAADLKFKITNHRIYSA
jgi:putative nucleotidyltransferase with HDIG domain